LQKFIESGGNLGRFSCCTNNIVDELGSEEAESSDEDGWIAVSSDGEQGSPQPAENDAEDQNDENEVEQDEEGEEGEEGEEDEEGDDNDGWETASSEDDGNDGWETVSSDDDEEM
jgi:hypothetical protein